MRYVQEQRILRSLCTGSQKVEIAQSIDEVMTSRSIVGRTAFPNFDMLDEMIASALKKPLDRPVHFRKRVISVEEQRAQKIRPSLTRKTNCVHDLSISEQPEPMKQHKDSQTCSFRMTTSKISTLDGIKLYYQEVKCLPM